MAVDITWNTTFRDRVRLLAGIEQVELDNQHIRENERNAQWQANEVAKIEQSLLGMSKHFSICDNDDCKI